MKRVIWFFILSSACFAGAFDMVEDYRDNKIYDEAKKEIIRIMYNKDTTNEIKAEGYFLLGDISLEQNDVEAAKNNWLRLLSYYPRSEFVKSALDKAALNCIFLTKDEYKQNFELFLIRMGMKENEFAVVKEDAKARFLKLGVNNFKIRGEFLKEELYKLDLYFEVFASFDVIKNISNLSRIENIKNYIESKVNREYYTIETQKKNDGRVYQIVITDKKIYSKRYQIEMLVNQEMMKRVEKEKLKITKYEAIEEIIPEENIAPEENGSFKVEPQK